MLMHRDFVPESQAMPTLSPDAQPPLLQVQGLKVSFRSEGDWVDVIQGVDFTVQRGEVVAVVGESGSGKSVSALAIMGLLPPFAQVTQGQILFQGQDLLKLDKEQMRSLRGRDIGMVFQDPMSALNPVLTIGEQIAEPLRLHLGMGATEARDRVIELLGLVGIADAESRLGLYPHEFSGGMRQRVMIAIALACNPRLLIADEPTTALDVTIQAQILELMKDLAQRLGIALLLITHNLGVVARYADRVLVMYGGQLMEQGKADTIFYHPRHMYTLGLLRCVPKLQGDTDSLLAEIPGLPPHPKQKIDGCRFAPRCPQRLAICAEPLQEQMTDVGSLSRCQRAEELAAGSLSWPPPVLVSELLAPEEARASQSMAEPDTTAAGAGATRSTTSLSAVPGEALLDVRNLSRVFSVRRGMWGKPRSVAAVRDVSFQLQKGETLGVVGESGCGKSTLARMVLRLDRPSAGEIHFESEDISNLGQRALRPVRQRMQVVFQDPAASLNPRRSLGEIVAEPLRVHGITKGATQTRARVEELLTQVGLRPDLYDRYSHQISGGQRQRVGIARALAMDPALLVCDEAVSALDVSVQAQVVNLLGELQQRHGLAYLFIAHDLAVVRHISTRVMVMYLGRVVEQGYRDDLYERPLHPYTQLLLDAVPGTDPKLERERPRNLIQGDLPSPFAPPSGCAFRTRCPRAVADCAAVVPPLREAAPGHFVACIRA